MRMQDTEESTCILQGAHPRKAEVAAVIRCGKLDEGREHKGGKETLLPRYCATRCDMASTPGAGQWRNTYLLMRMVRMGSQTGEHGLAGWAGTGSFVGSS